jgi:DNA polymerase V
MKELLLYQKGESNILIPLFHDSIHAGFESPAADYEEERIDLNNYVTKYPAATFYARVVGDCMTGSGIYPDDLLVVDRSLDVCNGDIVVGILDSEFILRAYFKTEKKEYLMPDNMCYKVIERTPTTEFEIWGVVPHSILNQRKRISARLARFNQFLP